MSMPRQLAQVLTWVMGVSACASAPTPPARVPAVVVEETPEAGACPSIESLVGDASYLAFVESEVAAVAESLGRDLCIRAAEGLSLSDSVEARMSGDVTIADTASGSEVTLRAWARRIPGPTTRWEDTFFRASLTQELALAAFPRWVASQTGLLALSRTEIVSGTWLIWLRSESTSTLCLQSSHVAPICWREAGRVTRVVPYEWTYRVDSPESDPEGFVAIYRHERRPIFHAIRTHPNLSRAFARGEPMLAHARPSWWPAPHRVAPNGEVSTPRWRPIGAERVETPDLGPLAYLAAENLHIEGRGRVPERDDAIVAIRGGRHRLLCARQEHWTCSDALGVMDGGNPHREDEYLDAFDLDGTNIAVMRSIRHTGGDAPGSESRGEAFVEFWQRRQKLVSTGAVRVGNARWRSDGSIRQMERALHAMSVESDGCMRIEGVESTNGAADLEFDATGTSAPLNLMRAGERVLLAPDFASLPDEVTDLGGRWRLDDGALVRVAACTGEPATRLVPIAIPDDLPAAAASCLALVNERIHEHELMPVVSGLACGATREQHGVVMGRQRFLYDDQRRVETVRVYRIQPSDTSRYVDRERHYYSRGRAAGYDLESIHYHDGEEECGNTFRRRETLDRHGRPTRIRSVSDTCEGVDAGVRTTRRTWHREEGFDHESGGDAAHYYIPSYTESVAQVSCQNGRCSCHIDVADEVGHSRLRLASRDPGERVLFDYSCPAEPWPTTDEALRALSVETAFD